MSVEYVTTVHPNDVLFGRGSGPNDHEGNIKFRDLVAQRKEEYMATNHRQTKAKIAKAIVDHVFAQNGRFLKKLEPKEAQKLGFATGMDVYSVADDDTIMEKAKQALRQNREKATSGSASNSVCSGGSGLPPSGGPIIDANNNMGNMGNLFPTPQVPGLAGTSPLYATDGGGFDFRDAAPLGAQVASNPMVGFGEVAARDQMHQEDDQGYATYTATLEDPDDPDPRFTMGRRSSTASGGRRVSMSGRKDGSRRGSIQMDDVWRRDSLIGGRGESMQMSELMESFKGMSTTGELESSTDTIGTIDGMSSSQPGYHMSGMSNMSAISMSSTTSLFKTASSEGSGSAGKNRREKNDEMNMGANNNNMTDGSWHQQQQQQQQMNHQQQARPARHPDQIIPPPQQRPSLVSLGAKDLWNSATMNLMRSPLDSSSNLGMGDSAKMGMGESSRMMGDSTNFPRLMSQIEDQPDSMGFLGSSSLSVLRAADVGSSGVLPPQDHHQQQQQQGRIFEGGSPEQVVSSQPK